MDMISGFVYILHSENDFYKIGRSINPHNRLKQLQTGSNKKLRLLYYLKVQNMIKAERSLHAIFSAGRKQGEWFKLTDRDVELLKKIFQQTNLTFVEKARLERMGLL